MKNITEKALLTALEKIPNEKNYRVDTVTAFHELRLAMDNKSTEFQAPAGLSVQALKNNLSEAERMVKDLKAAIAHIEKLTQ